VIASPAAHWILEAIAYAAGFRLFLVLRKRRGDAIPESTRITVIAGAALGSALGAKLLHALMDPAATLAAFGDPRLLLGGKTVVGGLLGGLAGVELVKKAIGETRSTGDLFVLPLCLAMSIGRVGCFLGGLADQTHGVETSLPWGVDFGDGVPRHPAQLYEIAVLGAIAAWAARRVPAQSGDVFKGFLLLYLAWRFAIEFLKPEPRLYFGLSAIQVAALVGIAIYVRYAPRVFLAPAGLPRDNVGSA
jgi:phosphatidylglycerol---prolipoprotein diacylglyceryl transferase